MHTATHRRSLRSTGATFLALAGLVALAGGAAAAPTPSVSDFEATCKNGVRPTVGVFFDVSYKGRWVKFDVRAEADTALGKPGGITVRRWDSRERYENTAIVLASASEPANSVDVTVQVLDGKDVPVGPLVPLKDVDCK